MGNNQFLDILSIIVVNVVLLCISWLILDNIPDAQTQIISSLIIIVYFEIHSFMYGISNALSYLIFYFARLRLDSEAIKENDLNIKSLLLSRNSLIDRIFHNKISVKDGVVSLMLIANQGLCLFRIYSSITGKGWNTVFEPLRNYLTIHF